MNSTTVPEIFRDLLTTSKADAKEKYRLCHEGAPASDTATAAQAEAYRQILIAEIAKRNLPLPAPTIIAIEGLPGFTVDGHPTATASVFRRFSLDQMLADGYPTDLRTRLYLQFSKQVPNEAEEFDAPTGSKTFEVADSIRAWFDNPNRVIEELVK